MSLPPDPPLSTSSSNIFLKKTCPKDGGNYTPPPFCNLICPELNLCDPIPSLQPPSVQECDLCICF